jgi:hypothetical protein
MSVAYSTWIPHSLPGLMLASPLGAVWIMGSLIVTVWIVDRIGESVEVAAPVVVFGFGVDGPVLIFNRWSHPLFPPFTTRWLKSVVVPVLIRAGIAGCWLIAGLLLCVSSAATSLFDPI